MEYQQSMMTAPRMTTARVNAIQIRRGGRQKGDFLVRRRKSILERKAPI
jgi:hypothetical protein